MTAPPTLRVEVAFESGADPAAWVLDAGALDSTAQLGAASVDVWTDITDDVRAIQITRGRARELEEYQAARLTIDLRNSHRKYDPTNLAGPHVSGGVTLVRPGRRVRVYATHPDTLIEYPMFFGTIRDWGIGYPDQRGFVTLTASDALADLASTDVTLTIPAGTPGAAVDAVMLEAGVARYIAEVGDVTLQSHAFTGNALAALQLIARSEFGIVYSDAAGFVRFRGRSTAFGSDDPLSFVVQGSFGGAGVLFRDLALDYSSDNLRNIVTLTRVGGTPQVARDDNSVAAYGPRAWSRDGLIVSTDTGLLAVAAQILAWYAELGVRVRGFTFSPMQSSAAMTQALAREVHDRLAVTFTPPLGGSAIASDVLIASVEHRIERGASMVTRYQLEHAVDNDVWVLGTSALETETKLAF